MTRKLKQVALEAESYASMESFCDFFLKEMDSFYQLAFLLTGSGLRAEQSLLAALDDCRRAKVFKPWLGSWSRLAVIERALKASTDSSPAESFDDEPMERRAILQLERLERFVYTLSVCEKYSIRDCAVLLRMSKREISEARERAMQAVSTFLATTVDARENAIALGA